MNNREYIKLADAIQRINNALSKGRTVLFSDGTLNRPVRRIDADAEDRFPYLTLTLDDGSHMGIEVTNNGYLDGWNLRDDVWSTIIAPASYLSEWPCNHPGCIVAINGFCAVDNCQGACVRPGRSYNTTAGAVRSYKRYMDSTRITPKQ